MGAFFATRYPEYETAFYLTQNAAGSIGSIMLTLPDTKVLLQKTNAIGMFQNLETISWILYFFSMIICTVIKLHDHHDWRRSTQVMTSIFIMLCSLIRHDSIQIKHELLKLVMIMYMLEVFLLTTLIRSSIKTDLITINKNYFIDNVEQLVDRKTMHLIVLTVSTFYIEADLSKNSHYKSIKQRLSEPTTLLMKSVDSGSKFIKNFSNGKFPVRKIVGILPEMHLTLLFKTICTIVSHLNYRIYYPNNIITQKLTFIPYSFKLTREKQSIVEYM